MALDKSTLVQNILNSIKTVADKSADETNNALTIEAEIIEIVDAGQGIYKVKYGGNKFQAYNYNGGISYSKGDNVYILVSEGDFTKPKLILGLVSPSTHLFINNDIGDDYELVSDNLVPNFYTKSQNLNSWEKIDNSVLIRNYGQGTDGWSNLVDEQTTLTESIAEYLNDYNTFILSAKIRTSFDSRQKNQGNYGIILKLPVITEVPRSEDDYIREVLLNHYSLYELLPFLTPPQEFYDNLTQTEIKKINTRISTYDAKNYLNVATEEYFKNLNDWSSFKNIIGDEESLISFNRWGDIYNALTTIQKAQALTIAEKCKVNDVLLYSFTKDRLLPYFDLKKLYDRINTYVNFELTGTQFENEYYRWKYNFINPDKWAEQLEKIADYLTAIELSTNNVKKSYTWDEIKLDVQSMTGTPYDFNQWSKQSLTFQLSSSIVFDKLRKSFIQVFKTNKITDKESIVLNGFNMEDGHEEDIFFKELSINAIRYLTDEEKNGYYLSLKASEGLYFGPNFSTTKIITPQLKVKGVSTGIDGAELYWFKEDPTINTTSDAYLSIGGLGWKCINDRDTDYEDETGNLIKNWKTNKYRHTVKREEVISCAYLKIKCVAIIDESRVQNVITLKELTNTNAIKFSVTPQNNISSFVPDTGNVNLNIHILYMNKPDDILLDVKFKRYDKDGNYIDDLTSVGKFITALQQSEQIALLKKQKLLNEVNLDTSLSTIEKEAKIKTIEENYRRELEDELGSLDYATYSWAAVFTFPVSAIIDSNRIDCYGVYYHNENSGVLGSVSLLLDTHAEDDYRVVLYGGDVLYKYDSDGDSPLIADYDGPLSSKITEKDIEPITYRIYDSSGQELTETEYKKVQTRWYIPIDSLITLTGVYNQTTVDNDYVIQNADSINYTIAPTYNINKLNNTIRLQVIYNKRLLRASCSPVFLKEGEGGSNGSRFAAIITCDGYGYGELDSNRRELKLRGFYDSQDEDNYQTDVDGNIINVQSTKWHLVTPRGNVQTYANLDVRIYKDGQLFGRTYDSQPEANANWKVEWTMFDIGITNPLFRFSSSIVGKLQTVMGRDWPADNELCQIVQAKITITNTEQNTSAANNIINNGEVIYAYYPIEIVRINTNIQNKTIISTYSSSMKAIPSIEGGFYQVLYGSNGINPKFDTTEPFTVKNDMNAINLYNYNWSFSGSLVSQNSKVDKIFNSINLIPKNRYTNSKNNNNYLKVVLEQSAEEFQKFKETLDAEDTGEESAYQKYSGISDGLKIFLDKAKKMSYNYSSSQEGLNNQTIKQAIETETEQYKYRGIILNYLNKLGSLWGNIKSNLTNNTWSLSFPSIVGSINILINDNDSFISKVKECVAWGNPLSSITTWSGNRTHNYVYSSPNATQFYVEPSRFKSVVEYNKAKAALESYYNYLNALGKWIYILENGSIKYTKIEYLGKIRDLWLELLSDALASSLTEDININQLLVSLKAIVESLNECLTQAQIEAKLQQMDAYLNAYWNGAYTNKYDEILDLYEYEYDLFNTKRQYYEVLKEIPTIEIVRPILLLLNRYELTHLADWDGNKLYVDEDNEQYLFAPQLGAGIKENNTFTGMTMGVRGFNKSETQQIGLFGYNDGEQTMFLNARDGSAIFGSARTSQIIVDPNATKKSVNSDGETTEENVPKALLYSGDFYQELGADGKPINYETTNERSIWNLTNWNDEVIEKMLLTATIDDSDYLKGITNIKEKKQAMLRQFARGMLIDLTTPEIRFANGNFVVTSAGYLTARGGGYIAGWEIMDDFLRGGNKTDGYTSLYSNNAYTSAASFSIGDDNGTIEKKEKPIRFNINDSFLVFGDGAIATRNANKQTAFSVDELGNLYSQSGTIGGWVIKEDKLVSPDQKTTLYSTDSNKYTNSYVSKLTTKEQSKKVRINVNDRLRIYSDGAIALQDEEKNTNFSVNEDGEIYSQYGLIGRWGIDKDKLISTDKKTILYATDDTKNKAKFYDGNDNGTIKEIDKVTRFDINKKFRLYADGAISIGTNKFSVDANGNLYANSGLIGGWIVQDDRLTSEDKRVTLMKDGTIFGGGETEESALWRIGADGYARFSNIEIDNTKTANTGSRISKDGSGALFEWGPVTIWNEHATHLYQKNAGQIGGWWLDKTHFTSSRDSGSPLELIGGGSGAISGVMFTLTGDKMAEFVEGIIIDGVTFKPVPIDGVGVVLAAVG